MPSRLDHLRLLLGQPRPVVWVGTVSATVLIPLVILGKAPARVVDIALFTSSDYTPDGTDYYAAEVLRIEDGSEYRLAGLRTTVTYGFRSGLWTTLVEDAGMLQDQAVAVRLIKNNAAANIAGVALSYGLEVR